MKIKPVALTFKDKRYEFDLLKLFKGLLVLLLTSFAALFVSLSIVTLPTFALIILVPVFIVVLWLFPKLTKVPINKILILFYIWLILSVLWPRYLVINIPGLFDIYASRLVLFLMIGYWALYFFKTEELRQNLFNVYRKNKIFFHLFAFYIGMRLFSIVVSSDPLYVLNYFVREFLDIIIPFFIFLSVILSLNEVKRFLFILFITSALVVFLGFIESINANNLFVTFLPESYINSLEYIQSGLADKVRGEYRVQSTFSHPLLLAQFLLMVLPLVLYFLLNRNKSALKASAIVILGFSLVFVLYETGSRSVTVGLGIQLALIALIHLVYVGQKQRGHILDWLLISSYPFMLLLGYLGSFFISRFIFGSSAIEASSTDARMDMWSQGLNILLSSPVGSLFGFGIGRSGMTLGYGAVEDHGYQIDSYLLSVLLDVGFIGFLLFIALFAYVFFIGFKAVLQKSGEWELLLTLVLSVAGYLSVALILSTAHNLVYLFLLYGAFLVVTTYRSDSRLGTYASK